MSSEHTQGCPLAQLTAFAALTDAVLVLCNSAASVTSITELGQKSVIMRPVHEDSVKYINYSESHSNLFCSPIM